ncbi:Phloem protein [Trema orientale]|uniref:Phloem protein n=1 Tax=Trema orientale TaxID=63057 RepID=A0A2P5DI39_TREOI|nr:Phloem protein [Trema orientale]
MGRIHFRSKDEQRKKMEAEPPREYRREFEIRSVDQTEERKIEQREGKFCRKYFPEKIMEITQLPEECISHIISLTSPRDACRSSLVSPLFRSVADSDVVWERFLPSDYRNAISQSVVFPVLNAMPKKSLYFHLYHNPVIIGDGNMSFSLDKTSGKKCYMIGARGLSITWGDTPQYWQWSPLPESRFPEVAKLKDVWWLHVVANVDTRILSPQTTYAAYLVSKLERAQHGRRHWWEPPGVRGFDRRPVNLRVYFEGLEDGDVLSVVLDPPSDMPQLPQDRGDGWKEIEMGNFFNENGEDGVVSCSLKEVSGKGPWSGLVVEGIELRPKASSYKHG